MRWTDSGDAKLADLVKQGKSRNEIALLLGVTKLSVNNRTCKLKIKTEYYAQRECPTCKEPFKVSIRRKHPRKFCSASCATTHSNIGRVHSDQTKEKIRSKLIGRTVPDSRKGPNSSLWIDGRSALRKTKCVDGKRLCKSCGEWKKLEGKRLLCSVCRITYYKFYRPSCEFDFDISKFPDAFDMTLVTQLGWYSPTNKGNNLGGVSRDHLYSVREGFSKSIDPEIIRHPANCQLMKHSDNNSKNTVSAITLDQLLDRIKLWDQRYANKQR